jgi:hypothetical protein
VVDGAESDGFGADDSGDDATALGEAWSSAPPVHATDDINTTDIALAAENSFQPSLRGNTRIEGPSRSSAVATPIVSP